MAQAGTAPQQSAGIATTPDAIGAARIRQTPFRGPRQFLTRLLKVRGSALGLGVLLALIFLAISAPLIAPASPIKQDLLRRSRSHRPRTCSGPTTSDEMCSRG